MLNTLKKISSSLKHTVFLSTIVVSCQASIAAISRTTLNAPGSQATVSYNPWDTMRVITNEFWTIDSLDFIPGDGLTTNYRFTQELLSTLSIPGKVTMIVIKLEKVSPLWSIPVHSILYDPIGWGILYRKLFPLPTWTSVSNTWSLNSSGFPSQTRYGIIRDPIVLPIELIDFGWMVDDWWYPYLSWSTTSEVNNKYFAIERSYDAVRFSEIWKVFWSWNSSILQQYNFRDNAVDRDYQWYIYYQLRQIDWNNDEHIVGNIVSLKVSSDLLYNNNDNILFHWWLLIIPWLDEYTIFSLKGKDIMNWKGPSLELSYLPIGIYILYDYQKDRVIRLIVQ